MACWPRCLRGVVALGHGRARGLWPCCWPATVARTRAGLDLIEALLQLPPNKVRLAARGTCQDAEFDARLEGRVAGHFELDLGPKCDGRDLARLAADCHLAVLPSRLPESYALELDEVLALGLPPWLTFGSVARERFDRSAFKVLPGADPAAWSASFAALLRDPSLSSSAFSALPRQVPGVPVESLERLYQDALAGLATTTP